LVPDALPVRECKPGPLVSILPGLTCRPARLAGMRLGELQEQEKRGTQRQEKSLPCRHTSEWMGPCAQKHTIVSYLHGNCAGARVHPHTAQSLVLSLWPVPSKTPGLTCRPARLAGMRLGELQAQEKRGTQRQEKSLPCRHTSEWMGPCAQKHTIISYLHVISYLHGNCAGARVVVHPHTAQSLVFSLWPVPSKTHFSDIGQVNCELFFCHGFFASPHSHVMGSAKCTDGQVRRTMVWSALHNNGVVGSTQRTCR
jgi:hypothetical protein